MSTRDLIKYISVIIFGLVLITVLMYAELGKDTVATVAYAVIAISFISMIVFMIVFKNRRKRK